ncbi:MAG TPA: phage tail protein [Lelliottia sp.]|jgi:hypothetical protein
MILGFGNNLVSSLASDITASQTAISVMPGDGPLFSTLLTSDFSNKSTTLKNFAKITLTDAGETAFEICHLIDVSNDTLTVIRGQEGTTAKGWSLKDVIANFATRGSENIFPQVAHIQSGFYTSGTAGGSANALTLELPSTFFLNGSVDWVLKTPLVVYPSQNNTAAATLQLTMGGKVLGSFPLYKGNKAQLVANDILKDVALVCLLDNSKTFFNVANPGAIYAGLGTAAFKDIVTSPIDTTAGRVLTVGYGGLGGYGTTILLTADQAKKPLTNGFYGVQTDPTYGNAALISFGYDSGSQVHLIAKQGGQAPLIGIAGSNPQGVFGAWGKIYTEFQKPTAADVGALPLAGGTMTGKLIMNTDSGAITLKPQTAGSSSYLISQNSAGEGSWYVGKGSNGNDDAVFNNYKGGNNTLILKSDGAVSINCANSKNLNITGQTIPSNYANFDARYQAKGSYAAPNTASKAANGWSQDASTGLIYQWCQGATANNNNNQTVTFPKAFPNACLFVSVGTFNLSNSIDAEQNYQLISKTNSNCVVMPNKSYGDNGNVAALVWAVGY